MYLLTNDDGIQAPGLAALERAMDRYAPRIIVAPRDHHSGCGHQATTHAPLRLTQLAENRHQLEGWPADCARVGLLIVAPGTQWLVSGINEGGNLGADVYMSGTVAAAREAALLGVRAIAVSQYVKRHVPLDWEQSAAWAAEVLRRLLAAPLEVGDFWNVNLPHLPPGEANCPPIVECRLDPHPLPVRYESTEGGLVYLGNYHSRAREPGSDVDECFAGRIAVTRLSVRGC
jgi:5'-nucleotidase